jgi:hypothetical protein
MHAMWVLWREIGCRMGVKYIPQTIAQAEAWTKEFEENHRWREQVNQDMAMGLLNQIIYPIPTPLQPFARKVAASILDQDIVYFNMLEHLGPSAVLRSVVFDVFRLCGWIVREFGLERRSPYQRSPSAPNPKTGLMNFDYTPYETTPFYIKPTFWRTYGPGAFLRRLRGIPLPSVDYFGEGIAFESMGAPFRNPGTQLAVESKVRKMATELEKAPLGFRPNIGWQGYRLVQEYGPSYGMAMNQFPPTTSVGPASADRFDKEWERRGPGFSKLDKIEEPHDVTDFAADEISQSPSEVFVKKPVNLGKANSVIAERDAAHSPGQANGVHSPQ